MEVVAHVVAFAAGAAVVVGIIASAIVTVILPRAVPARITRAVFLAVRRLLHVRMGRRPSFERYDHVMASYAPFTLLALVLVWLTIVMAGYVAMFWALEDASVRDAFVLSGSSLLTLGFSRPDDLPGTALAFSEAGIGLLLLALLITFLPTIYNAFSRREVSIAHLEVRAGSPPSGVEMLQRYWAIGRLEGLDDVWVRWEGWFVEVQETHTTFPVLAFFRSPQPEHSWVTAAGAVLDGAALRASTVEAERDPQAELCIRSGYIALRRIADYFGIPYDPDPRPTDPISITREEYDAVYDTLARRDVPVRADRDQAWRDFAGWRVNYDVVLLALAGLVGAPWASWSSDRAAAFRAPSVLRLRHRQG